MMDANQMPFLLLILGLNVHSSSCSVFGLCTSRSWIGTRRWFFSIRTLFGFSTGA